MQRPNIKINKTWLMLIIAIVLSLVTAWLTMQYLNFREKNIEAEFKARAEERMGETVAVVVPIRGIEPGTVLREEMVAARNVPADLIYDDTITVAQFDAYKGQALLRAVQRGRPLRKSDVREVFADFSGSLKPGKRAMTITVDEVNSIAHMVEPGNYVDLLLVLSGGENSTESQTVMPFLDQVQVLATGQKVTQDDPSSSNNERRRTYGTLTLEVTPAQAARLSLALEIGKVRAVLRNEKDRQMIEFDTISAQNFLEDVRERERRIAAARPPRPQPTVRTPSGLYVEYIIGGRGDDAVAPSISVPVQGVDNSAATPAAQVAAQAQAASAQTLSDLIKLSAGSKAPGNSK